MFKLMTGHAEKRTGRIYVASINVVPPQDEQLFCLKNITTSFYKYEKYNENWGSCSTVGRTSGLVIGRSLVPGSPRVGVSYMSKYT